MMSGDIVTKTKNIRVGTRPVPADGFYEWTKVLGGKIPYSISMKDDSPFVFAGLWEGWKDPANISGPGTDQRIAMLQGKIIGITGIIELYQGKPEIEVTSTDQIKGLDFSVRSDCADVEQC
jgi:hypothetical protein